eukprot:CAMPEP_0172489418 /NCGR_PEP_ID=MMETSP1066-20121228/19376_1 /TAXON_ID=671091 /ORGANISM="Coscinodiscus wailesii, Strain CCMP2513" /LENGTH=340 /DNA_ID=CAMNT_0013257241 /DNA_START=103 /DNA_END=1122 /DNA_ORIENTATION=+
MSFRYDYRDTSNADDQCTVAIVIARGTFGEVSIAAVDDAIGAAAAGVPRAGKSRIVIHNSCDEDDPPRGRKRHRYVAVKTIQNATVADSPAAVSSWGGGGNPAAVTSSSPAKILKPVYYEIFALRHLSPHPNICPLLSLHCGGNGRGNDLSSSSSSLSLTFPYCPVDLATILSHRRSTARPFPTPVVRAVLYQLLTALRHAHSRNIIHRDVTPSNLLVSHSGTIQLSDFGLACPIFLPSRRQRHEYRHVGLCALPYRPPETLYGVEEPSPGNDVWSAGTVLAELASLRVLFDGRTVLDQIGRIVTVVGLPPPAVTTTVLSSWPDFDKVVFKTSEEGVLGV